MFVDWLNETFHIFDYALLELCHKLAEFGHPVLTDILHFISFSGEYAILLFLSGVILCMFPQTRKAGVSEIGSVLIGCIIGKGFLKRVVARPRPYEVVGSDYLNGGPCWDLGLIQTPPFRQDMLRWQLQDC